MGGSKDACVACHECLLSPYVEQRAKRGAKSTWDIGGDCRDEVVIFTVHGAVGFHAEWEELRVVCFGKGIVFGVFLEGT